VIQNVGQDEDLSGWELNQQVDAIPERVYRFPNEYFLKSGTRIRVLSRDHSKVSSPQENDLIAENIAQWSTGRSNLIRLTDKNGIEKAILRQNLQ
jgi:hypothetical protein